MIHLTKRFEAAVFALVGDGPVKQRLGRAYSQHLDDMHPEDLPEPMRQRFETLHAAMHTAPPIGKEGSLKVTVRKMSFAEASEYAEQIVELYAELLRSVEREPLKIVRNEESTAPQRASAGGY